MHKRFSARQGFTIIEVVISAVIIGILSTITVVVYNGVQDSAHENRTLAELDRAYSEIASWKLSHDGLPPDEFTDINFEMPENITFTYWKVGTSTYCLDASYNSGQATFYRATTSQSSEEGLCGDSIDWVAGEPLAFTDVPGSTVNLSKPIIGTPEITLYTLFYTVDASGNYSSFAGLGNAGTNNRFYFQASAAGNTGAGYRIDTPLQTNVTAAQAGVRTGGYHTGWMQTRDNGTVRAYAFDNYVTTSTGTLTAHSGWNFTNLFLINTTATYRGVSAVVYDKAHTEETRKAVMNWLALKEGNDLWWW